MTREHDDQPASTMTREQDDVPAPATAASAPIACNLTTAELRARRDELRAAFAGSIVRVTELPDGYRLELAPRAGLLATVGQFIELERECCPFLSFTVSVTAEHGDVALAITGADGVKDFLSASATALAQEPERTSGCCGGGCA